MESDSFLNGIAIGLGAGFYVVNIHVCYLTRAPVIASAHIRPIFAHPGMPKNVAFRNPAPSPIAIPFRKLSLSIFSLHFLHIR